MSDQPADGKMPNPERLAKEWAKLAERSQKIVSEFPPKQGAQGSSPVNPDPLNLGAAFLEMTQKMMANPEKIVSAQMALWQDYLKLWQSTADRFMGKDTKPVVEAAKGDRRFADKSWNEYL